MKTLNSDKFASKYILPNSALSQAPAEDTKRRDEMAGHPRASLLGGTRYLLRSVGIIKNMPKKTWIALM